MSDYTNLFKKYLAHTDEKEAAVRALKKNFPKGKYSRLLDVGCGSGSFIKLLLGSFIEIVALDKEKRLDDQLLSQKNIRFFQKDFFDYKADGSFDFILLAYVLWEIPFNKWDAFFKKIFSLLERKGCIVIVDAAPQTKYDNVFFNFNIGIPKKSYPDLHEYLKKKNLIFNPHYFISKIHASSPNEMYEILRFFFREGLWKKFYSKNKKKIIADLYKRQNGNDVVIKLNHCIDLVYLPDHL